MKMPYSSMVRNMGCGSWWRFYGWHDIFMASTKTPIASLLVILN